MAHLSQRGYVRVGAPNHPRATKRGVVFEHILVAEKALGRYLPDGAVVHHVNGIKTDNRPTNLVVCEDQAYHLLLHRRQRAYEATGHADWLWCGYCERFDAPSALRVRKSGQAHHLSCAAKWQVKYRESQKRGNRRFSGAHAQRGTK